MNIPGRTTTVSSVALLAALMLPVAGSVAPQAAADDSAPGVTTLALFEHDTQQTSLHLGPVTPGPGDQLLFAGDVFDHPGGTKLGHIAGQCTNLSGNATAGDILCSLTFVLDGGQISTQVLADRVALFDGQTVPISIVSGTGKYRDARGDGTIQLPNQTDGNVVLNVITG